MTQDGFPQMFNAMSLSIISGSNVGKRWEEIVLNSRLGKQDSNSL